MIFKFLQRIWNKIKSETAFSDTSEYSIVEEGYNTYLPHTFSNSLYQSLGLSLAGSLVVSFLSSYYFIINLL